MLTESGENIVLGTWNTWWNEGKIEIMPFIGTVFTGLGCSGSLRTPTGACPRTASGHDAETETTRLDASNDLNLVLKI